MQKALSQIQQAEIAFEEFSKNQQEELLQANISLERLEIQYNEKIKEKNELLEKQKNQEYLFLVNDVKQKKVELEDTYNTLEDYYIQAPFDGIITKNDIKPGDRLTPDSQNSISIVDPNTIEINTQVSQSDIVKISI
ncbi:MAG: HlyD family efflux transporter periplasmic adaptor subunit [Patescibacteria group bacterium]